MTLDEMIKVLEKRDFRCEMDKSDQVSLRGARTRCEKNSLIITIWYKISNQNKHPTQLKRIDFGCGTFKGCDKKINNVKLKLEERFNVRLEKIEDRNELKDWGYPGLEVIYRYGDICQGEFNLMKAKSYKPWVILYLDESKCEADILERLKN